MIRSEVGTITNHQHGKGLDMADESSGGTPPRKPILMRPEAEQTLEHFQMTVFQNPQRVPATL